MDNNGNSLASTDPTVAQQLQDGVFPGSLTQYQLYRCPMTIYVDPVGQIFNTSPASANGTQISSSTLRAGSVFQSTLQGNLESNGQICFVDFAVNNVVFLAGLVGPSSANGAPFTIFYQVAIISIDEQNGIDCQLTYRTQVADSVAGANRGNTGRVTLLWSPFFESRAVLNSNFSQFTVFSNISVLY
jgi:hypothetical protein